MDGKKFFTFELLTIAFSAPLT